MRRDPRCGVTCLLNLSPEDLCAYCQVEHGVGPFGTELPLAPERDDDPETRLGDWAPTEHELIVCLIRDLGLDRFGKLGFAVAEAAAFVAGQGYVEGGPIREAYPELFCAYCGRLHRGECS